VTHAELLGWSSFRDLLARFAGTPPGRDRALALTPAFALAEVRAALAQTREARRARDAEGEPPWTGFGDPRPVLAEAAPAGATLDGPSLAGLARGLTAAAHVAGYGARIAGVAPGLSARCRTLPLAADLAQALHHALDPDGRLLDDASPRLRSLRREIGRLRGEIQSRLERLLDHPQVAPALQERYVTVRNGRYVIPVRDDARRAIRGIIHDRSQSGATVFVEPDQVLDLNNLLTQRSLEERDEMARILAALSERVRAALPELTALADGIARLDLDFARAGLAERLHATEPEVTEDGPLDLRAARHPLLVAQGWAAGAPARAVVPVDLHLPVERPGLVLSGPNAGGKTVALETAGLLVLMAQSGCHLPVAAGSRIPLTDGVLAVIGDEQSLEQNLSTFSSFVAQMREILAVAGPRTLVLLDELGAGTDPTEGAALGTALLEALLERGARVIATTHLEPLKVFAQVEPRLENATVAFDAERLAPTFHLEYGHPGPSYALTIGERLGLPADVIARARGHLGEEARRLDRLLSDLAAREREAADARAAAHRREAEAAAALERARLTAAAAEREATRLRERAGTEARELLATTRRQVGHELDRLRAEEATRRRAQETYQRLRAAEAALAGSPAAPSARGAGPAALPAEVQLRGLGLRGRVVAEDGETVTVEAGRLRVRVARREVEAAAPAGAPAPTGAAAVSVPWRAGVPRELHLRGFATDEARAAVEKFLDDAVLAGHDLVRLIHGKGTGALRRAVEQCLRVHPLVHAFRPAAPVDGGTGVTEVELVAGDAP
jgi:DNA mismatch repair protein MutS2